MKFLRFFGLLFVIAVAGVAHADPFENATVERIGKRLATPWGMTPISDDRMLVTLKTKGMVIVDLNTGKHSAVSGVPKFKAIGQGGLLDVEAVQRAAQDVVFSCFSKAVQGGATVAVTRSVLDGSALRDTVEIFQSNHAGSSGRHFGCRLAVSGENLFLSLGDRGDRENTSQDGSNHAGSIIRMTQDGKIYKGAASDWALGVYSIGHRNPQGLRINPTTGDLWAHEHGPQGGDEINIIARGNNYGWPRVSHGQEYGGGRIGEGNRAAGLTDPIWVWTPSIAPSGMDFYRGSMFSDLKNTLLVGSLKFQSLYVVDLKNGRPQSEEPYFKRRLGRIRDVHVLQDGSILLLTDEDRGGLYRISK